MMPALVRGGCALGALAGHLYGNGRGGSFQRWQWQPHAAPGSVSESDSDARSSLVSQSSAATNLNCCNMNLLFDFQSIAVVIPGVSLGFKASLEITGQQAAMHASQCTASLLRAALCLASLVPEMLVSAFWLASRLP